jgi:hypothetical protein
MSLFSWGHLLIRKLYARVAQGGIHNFNSDFPRGAGSPGRDIGDHVLSAQFLTNLSEDSCEVPDLLWEN